MRLVQRPRCRPASLLEIEKKEGQRVGCAKANVLTTKFGNVSFVVQCFLEGFVSNNLNTNINSDISVVYFMCEDCLFSCIRYVSSKAYIFKICSAKLPSEMNNMIVVLISYF